MYVLRDYRQSDFETLYKIDQECFDPELAYSRAELNHYLLRKGAFAVIAEDKKKNIVGFVVAESDRRGFSHIITIDVVKGARRTGLGAKLMAAVEQKFRASGTKVVLLETAVDNAAALHFYKRLNYTVEKVIPRYYNGERDAFLLSKRL